MGKEAEADQQESMRNFGSVLHSEVAIDNNDMLHLIKDRTGNFESFHHTKMINTCETEICLTE